LSADLTGEAYSAPPDRLAGLGGGPPWEKKEGEKEGGEGKEGNGVPECLNPELASLSNS